MMARPARLVAGRRLALVLALAFADNASAEEPPKAPAPETGWNAQGLPLLSYNSDDGFGYGLRLLLIDHASGEPKPYRYALTAQFFQTTKGVAASKSMFEFIGPQAFRRSVVQALDCVPTPL